MPDAGGLPIHLRGDLDVAIQQAEVDYLQAKQRSRSKWYDRWNAVFIAYLGKVFFAFTAQACKAGDEGIWTVEQIRHEVKAYSRRLIAEQYADKWPGSWSPSSDVNGIIAGFERDLRDTEQWAIFQNVLLKLATQKRPERKIVAIYLPDLGTQLDRCAAHLDVKHEELARRIGIGKTTYFAVKNGSGKRTTRMKVERYLKKHLETSA